MIPLRDMTPSRTFPGVVVALISVNVLAFLHQARLGPDLELFLRTYGIVPANYLDPRAYLQVGLVGMVVPLFAHMFLHGGFLHILGNLWFLWVFGDNVEDRLGHWRFLAFYLLCGLAAAALQIVTAHGSTAPMIGASGAIAGVLGAYIVMYPLGRINALLPLGCFFFSVQVPAFLFLGLWFLIQLNSGMVELPHASQVTGGVAWWAHIGGFAAGIALVRVMAPVSRRKRYITVTRL